MRKLAEALVSIIEEPDHIRAYHRSTLLKVIISDGGRVKFHNAGSETERRIDPETSTKIVAVIGSVIKMARSVIANDTEVTEANEHMAQCSNARETARRELARTRQVIMEEVKKRIALQAATAEIRKITIPENSEQIRREIHIEINSAGQITKFEVRNVTES